MLILVTLLSISIFMSISQMRQNLIFHAVLIMVISNSKVLCFYIEFCKA